MSETDLPEEALHRAWARAFRHSGSQAVSHDDARVVALPDDLIVSIAIDERDDGRFARVSIRRGRGPALAHEEAVPIVARVYLAGRFEPFPVECVVGADGATLHYVIDVEAYKEAKTQDHIAKAASMMGAEAQGGDAEIAAMQLACPLWALARTWDPAKVRERDGRTIAFLSDRFLVPRRWIEFQIDHFLAELEEGAIDEAGMPTRGTETEGTS
jgi:hypothetical protein